jgi:hypothetical protein
VRVRDALRRRWLALVQLVLTAAGSAATIGLDLAAPAEGPGLALAPDGAGWPYALLGLGLAVCATVVLVCHAGQRFGWALAGLGAFWMLDGLSQSYVRYAIGTRSRPAHSCPGATSSCSVISSGRRPPRREPAAWPTSCRRDGSG